MTQLYKIKCIGCEGGIPPLSEAERNTLLTEVKDWCLNKEATEIYKNFSFANFYETMAFVNAVAWIANQENHHPDMEVGYNYCLIKFRTHAINALTENDFICAAKIDFLSFSEG